MGVQKAAYLAIGRITGAHGVTGEIKVKSLTDFPERFTAGTLLFVEGERFQRKILSVRPHKGMLLISLSNLKDRTAAELLKCKHLFVAREDALPLEEDEYYEDELVGLQVETEEGEHLGELIEIIWTGANEVYIIHGARGEVLIPAIADVVQKVNLEKGTMKVKLLPGLIE
jgi:16S rRNA processing protein RimM